MRIFGLAIFVVAFGVTSADGGCLDTNKQCNKLMDMCNLESMRTLLQEQCAKTCGFCKDDKNSEPKKPTEDQPKEDPACVDKSSRCPFTQKACKIGALKASMERQCAKTCGFCKTEHKMKPVHNKLSGDTCTDKITNCDDIEDLCHDEDVNSIMMEQCARSCGFCDQINNMPDPEKPDENPSEDEECVDVNDSCAEAANQCSNDALHSLMSNECRKTCGFCKSNDKKPNAGKPKEEPKKDKNCADMNPNCAVITELCNDDSEYSRQIMRAQCPRTCGYCGKENSDNPDKNSTPKPDQNQPPKKPNKQTPKKPNKQTPKKPNKQTPKKPNKQPAKGECVDTVPHCVRIQKMCSSTEPYVKASMLQKCQKTCNLCKKAQKGKPAQKAKPTQKGKPVQKAKPTQKGKPARRPRAPDAKKH